MNQFLVAAALIFSGVLAQAEAVTTTCSKTVHEYAKITAVVTVDRDADTGARVLAADLFMNTIAIGAAENNCNSRRCVFTAADATYTLTPKFRKNSDDVVGVHMSVRSPVIVYGESLGQCAKEDEAG